MGVTSNKLALLTDRRYTMSKIEELKTLNAEKKALNEKQKALREELNANKTERIDARKVQAEARKSVIEQKADLRDLTAKTYSTFSKGSAEDVNKLADEIMEVAAELAGTIRKFAEATVTLNEL